MRIIPFLLGVIAINLTILTFIQLTPRAQADGKIAHYATVPVNEDGSITVRLAPENTLDVKVVGSSTTLDVNIDRSKTLDVKLEGGRTMDVNIKEVGGSSVSQNRVPVELGK